MLSRGKTDLICAAQDSQIIGATENIPCPYAASYRCGMSFATEHLALLHAQWHYTDNRRLPCPYAIQYKCSRTWSQHYVAYAHSMVHTKEKARMCPGCKVAYGPQYQMKVHQQHCRSLQLTLQAGEEAKWVEPLLEVPRYIISELEHAYYCREAEEWKVR